MEFDYLRVVSIAICASGLYAAMTFFPKGYCIPTVAKVGCFLAFILGALALWWLEYRQAMKMPRKAKSSGVKASFDWSMHYFRAFAILAIMGTHYAGSFGYTTLVNVALTSSTIFFLFISGYLCQYIDLKRRESPTSYYKKKLLNVIAPFVVFSLIFGYMKGMLGFNWEFVKALLCGEIQGQYWYIPFVSGLFLVSPFICRMNNKHLLLTVLVTFFAFLAFPFRPGGFALAWPHTFYLYTYFTIFYVVGFVYCRFKESIDQAVRPYWYLFAGAAVILLLMLWCPDVFALKCVERDMAIALQRFMVLVCVVLGLAYLKDKKISILDNLAKYSFTLYFIHFGLFAQTHVIHDKLVSVLPLPLLVSEIIVFVLYVAGMLVAAMLVKTVLGKYSRSVLGS